MKKNNQHGSIMLIMILIGSILAFLFVMYLRTETTKFFVMKEPELKKQYLDEAYKVVYNYYVQHAREFDAYELKPNELFNGSKAAVFNGTFSSNSVYDPRTIELQKFFDEHSPIQLKYGLKIRISDQECDVSSGLLTNTTVCGRKIALFYDTEENVMVDSSSGELITHDPSTGDQIISYFSKPIKSVTGETAPVKFMTRPTVGSYRLIEGSNIQRALVGETLSVMINLAKNIEQFGRAQFLQDPTRDINPNYFKAANCASVQTYELGCSGGLIKIDDNAIRNLKLDIFGFTAGKLTTAWGTPLYINNDNGNTTQKYHVLTVAQTAFPPYTASIASDVPWFKPVLGNAADNSDAGTGLYIKITQQLS